MSSISYPLKDGKGFVELLDSMGNDLTAVNAARVSYNKESAVLDDKAKKLINYLMKNKHGTPFEHNSFTFRIKAPLFVVQQWERHRMASYNEESGRYIEMRPEFYCPAGPSQEYYTEKAESDYGYYRVLLSRGETKERARIVLPLSLYKSFWFTCNARSLMNFLSLRNDDHAQSEIRAYARDIEEIFREVMPETWLAWINNGRRAP
jgi:thymidylate synthase (FAD)